MRPRVFGHVRGCSRIKPIVKAASAQGVQALTLFAFSTENWVRPQDEITVLWQLLKKFLAREINSLERENVRLRVIGEIERLNEDVQSVVSAAVERLSRNTGLQLTFAVSYGSRQELIRAARSFASDCLRGAHLPDQLDESLMSRYLWTSELEELSQVDLVIRTSGEKRLSNFLLWQAAYAEYIFVDHFWPDFSQGHFEMALNEYSNRKRRFGGLWKADSPLS